MLQTLLVKTPPESHPHAKTHSGNTGRETSSSSGYTKKTIREQTEQNPYQYAIKVHYQKTHKNRSISMKHQLMLLKTLNPEAQILQCQGGNWRLVGRRTGREELPKERTSLYRESQGVCGAVSPREWVCSHGAAKQGTHYLVPQLSQRPPYVHDQSSTTARRASAEAQSSVQTTKPACKAG